MRSSSSLILTCLKTLGLLACIDEFSKFPESFTISLTRDDPEKLLDDVCSLTIVVCVALVEAIERVGVFWKKNGWLFHLFLFWDCRFLLPPKISRWVCSWRAPSKCLLLAGQWHLVLKRKLLWKHCIIFDTMSFNLLCCKDRILCYLYINHEEEKITFQNLPFFPNKKHAKLKTCMIV